MTEDVVSRLNSFIENEMRSCSMDVGGITPEYQRLRGIGHAPKDFDYKKELEDRF